MADANILKPFVLAWDGGYVFQSTPLRSPKIKPKLFITFQSTPLREGRLHFAPHIVLLAPTFQSTPLREGRRAYPRQTMRANSFNPRPYVRGDVANHGLDIEVLQVSIHAPT